MKTEIRRDIEALWSVEDVAEYLAVPVGSVHKIVSERSIPHLWIGEHLRFRRLDIDRWLDLLVVPCRDQALRPVSLSVDNPVVTVQHPSEAPLSVPRALPQVVAPTSRPSPPSLSRAAQKPPTVPAPLGRGGPEHLYLQELVKRMGEAHGFRVTIEQPVLEGQGSVDVALERNEWRLACEILVAAGQEVGNVQKCLAAGFNEVAVVSPGKRQSEKLKKALAKEVTQEDLARVSFLTPGELPSYFDELPARADKVYTFKGYTVRVRYHQTDPADQERRMRRIAEIISKSFLRMKKEGGS